MYKVVDVDLREKMYKKRRKLEIVRDMLFIVSVKTRKTKIMYQANLSYPLMEKYLKNLLGSGLVQCVDDSFYLITGKGKEFLQMYADYLERCRRIGEDLNGARKDGLLLENICFNNESSSKRTPMKRQVFA